MEIVYDLRAGHSGRIYGFIMMQCNNLLLLLYYIYETEIL